MPASTGTRAPALRAPRRGHPGAGPGRRTLRASWRGSGPRSASSRPSRSQPPEDFGPLDAAIRDLDSFDWLVFTSVNGVEAFLERLRHHGLDLRAVPRETKVAAIGPATAERLEEVGLRVDVVPEEFRAEALIEAIGRWLARRQARPHPAGEGGPRDPAAEAPGGGRRGGSPARLRVRAVLRGQRGAGQGTARPGR